MDFQKHRGGDQGGIEHYNSLGIQKANEAHCLVDNLRAIELEALCARTYSRMASVIESIQQRNLNMSWIFLPARTNRHEKMKGMQ